MNHLGKTKMTCASGTWNLAISYLFEESSLVFFLVFFSPEAYTQFFLSLALGIRLRRSGQPSLLSHSSSHKSFTSPQDSAEEASDEDEDDDENEDEDEQLADNKSAENTALKASKEETV